MTQRNHRRRSSNRSSKVGPDQQLEALYGGSVFGRWPAKTRALPARGLIERLKPAPTLKGVAWVTGSVVLGFTLFAFFAVALNSKERREHHEVAEVARRLVEAGSVAQLETIVEPGLPWHQWSGLEGEDADAMVLADALLFRFHDADPVRLHRVKRWAADHPQVWSTVAAQGVVASERTRAHRVRDFQGLLAQRRDPVLAYLVATSLDAGEDRVATLPEYENLTTLGATHLPYLRAVVDYYVKTDRGRRLRSIVKQMSRVDEGSVWTVLSLAKSKAATRHTDEAQRMLEVVLEADLAPVPRSETSFALADIHAAQGRREEALQALRGAVDAVGRQEAFVLDYFDRLVTAGRAEVAAALTLFEGFPTDQDVRRECERRLNLLEIGRGGNQDAPPVVREKRPRKKRRGKIGAMNRGFKRTG